MLSQILNIDPNFRRFGIQSVISQPIVFDDRPIDIQSGADLVFHPVKITGLIETDLKVFLLNPAHVAMKPRPGQFAEILKRLAR